MRKLLVLAVRMYQAVISPVVGNCCRFEPSCSTYTIQAIEKYGCVKGLWLGVKRICRCRPYCPGGFDPVPEFRGNKS